MSDVPPPPPNGEDRPFVRIPNQAVWDQLQAVREDVRAVKEAVTEKMPALEKRVRSLELRFYGILAGLIAALGTIVYVKGV